MEFRSTETIPKENFLEDAETCLALSASPDTSVQDVVEGANLLGSKLKAVDEGRLAIEPPLTSEERASLSSRVAAISDLGSKALGQLEQATSRGKGRRSKKDKQAQPAATTATFAGKGDSVKR